MVQCSIPTTNIWRNRERIYGMWLGRWCVECLDCNHVSVTQRDSKHKWLLRKVVVKIWCCLTAEELRLIANWVTWLPPVNWCAFKILNWTLAFCGPEWLGLLGPVGTRTSSRNAVLCEETDTSCMICLLLSECQSLAEVGAIDDCGQTAPRDKDVLGTLHLQLMIFHWGMLCSCHICQCTHWQSGLHCIPSSWMATSHKE